MGLPDTAWQAGNGELTRHNGGGKQRKEAVLIDIEAPMDSNIRKKEQGTSRNNKGCEKTYKRCGR